MGLFDRFLDSIRLNDSYDDYDEDDFFDDEDEDEIEEEEEKKPKRKFFQRSVKKKDEAEEDFPEEKHTKTGSSEKAQPKVKTSFHTAAKTKTSASSKVTPIHSSSIRKSMLSNMEVCVIRPTKVEDYREIADTLLSNCTVILNLEGIDVELAQRIIDFSSGSCYAINGSLQKISGYIFVLTPENVEISGDIQDILNGAIPSMRTSF